MSGDFAKVTALSVGQVTHDRYGDDLVPGGCAYFGAKTIAALGARSRLVTSMGVDFRCDESLDGIDVHALWEGSTTTFSNVYSPGELRIQVAESSSPALRPDMVPDSFLEPDLLFLAPVMGELQASGWRARVQPGFMSLGLQGLMKKAGREKQGTGRVVVPLGNTGYLDCIEEADAVFLSREDIELFGANDTIRMLRSLVSIVVITDGENGCVVYRGDESWDVSVYPCVCVDPTGAGDTFAAACSLALSQGWSPDRAARLGAAAASVVVEGRGGATLDRIHAAFERLPLVPPDQKARSR